MEKGRDAQGVRTICHALSMTTISKLIFFIGDYRGLNNCINSLPQECSSYDPRLGFGEQSCRKCLLSARIAGQAAK
ncbi:hypothetical protein [Pectobacterium atrosepticum]|uniref:hypothetical protein n=1 Tax=Pectobacterium atrosepticum TaxID=29471 RepID=UPI0002EBBD11|nr:hypothetical protein [Pectobacterium atrosepticum]